MIRTVAKTSTATLMILTLGTDEPIDCEFNMRMLNQSSICLMKSGTFHTQWTALEDAITVSDMPLEASRQHSGHKGHDYKTAASVAVQLQAAMHWQCDNRIQNQKPAHPQRLNCTCWFHGRTLKNTACRASSNNQTQPLNQSISC
jgi:hypothetical protein